MGGISFDRPTAMIVVWSIIVEVAVAIALPVAVAATGTCAGAGAGVLDGFGAF